MGRAGSVTSDPGANEIRARRISARRVGEGGERRSALMENLSLRSAYLLSAQPPSVARDSSRDTGGGGQRGEERPVLIKGRESLVESKGLVTHSHTHTHTHTHSLNYYGYTHRHRHRHTILKDKGMEAHRDTHRLKLSRYRHILTQKQTHPHTHTQFELSWYG